MLELLTVIGIEDALAEGDGHSEIARRFGVSRGTVGEIAHDQWCLKARPPATPDPPRKLGRCPTCGRVIRLPCLACGVKRRAGPALPPEPDELQLELEGDDLARYRALRAGHRRGKAEDLESLKRVVEG